MADVVGAIGAVVAVIGIGAECCMARRQEKKLQTMVNELRTSNEELRQIVSQRDKEEKEPVQHSS